MNFHFWMFFVSFIVRWTIEQFNIEQCAMSDDGVWSAITDTKNIVIAPKSKNVLFQF